MKWWETEDVTAHTGKPGIESQITLVQGDLNMDENTVVNEDVVEEGVVLDAVADTSIAAEIQSMIDNLVAAKDCAVKFEGGIDSQIGLKKTAIELRKFLMSTRQNSARVYADVLDVKEALLETVGDVKVDSTKSKLEAKLADIQAKLEALNAGK